LGASANVTFQQADAQQLLVPMTGIFQQGDKPAVWVIGKDDKLRLRAVRVQSYTNEGAHIAEGLVAGERIVTAGVNRLHEGEQVKVDSSAKSPH
jgi:multidrug efflux system membrane fusion protein